MTHPITYYVDSHPAIATLEAKFGSNLQQLNDSEKSHLIALLALREHHREGEPDEAAYTLQEAYQDTPFSASLDVFESLMVLEPLPSRQSRGLILALASQIS